MFHGSALINCWSYACRLRQRVVGGYSLLTVVFVSTLLHVTGLAVAGEAPIPIIEVKLTEFTVELPKTVPVGKMIFSVTNAGTMEHNFEFEGQGIEKKFDMNLKPGETRNLQVDLPAGTYIIYCPVNDHRKRGMHWELMVAQQQSHRVTPSISFRVLP
jgi:Cupredoxin-like domain